MTDVKQQRKVHVQTLRKCAKICGVPVERDDANRARIQHMAAAIAEIGERCFALLVGLTSSTELR